MITRSSRTSDTIATINKQRRKRPLPTMWRLASLACLVLQACTAPLAVLGSDQDAQRWRIVLDERPAAARQGLARVKEVLATDKAQVQHGDLLSALPELGLAYATATPALARRLAKIEGVDSVTPSKSGQYLQPPSRRPQQLEEGSAAAAAAPAPDSGGDGSVLAASDGDAQVALQRDSSQHKQRNRHDQPKKHKKQQQGKKDKKDKHLHTGPYPGLTGLQWGLKAIDANKAWKAGLRGMMGEGENRRPVRVAVLDQGFYPQHPTLAANVNMDLSKSFVKGEDLRWRPKRAQYNAFSHGTWTAGIIAGVDRGGAGTTGVAPEAELLLIKVISDNADSSQEEDIFRGMHYAVDNGADIINLSLGAGPAKTTDDGVRESIHAFTRAVAYATAHNVTVIAAAGNELFDFDKAHDQAVWPAQLADVIAVAATGPYLLGKRPHANLDRPAFEHSNYGGSVIATRRSATATGPYLLGKRPHANLDRPAFEYSNYGASVIAFAAPGGGTRGLADGNREHCRVPELGVGQRAACYNLDLVYGACCHDPDRGYYHDFNFGTSAAAPHAAGVAALAMSRAGRRLAPSEVRSALIAAADDLGPPGRDPRFGFGRVNAGRLTEIQLL
ncbi:peptidase S8/S53 domain-containing protein [Tribonema minus]|uniref:subtilisin n=1 Tax=Tribonema minus TaxID=303371 RepID=A0A835Z3M5_9STRA|nr:peptidase S8/S53 domain-containing protein [Tribonema minus]